MYLWSKALPVALVAGLWSYGATALPAKDHKDHKDQSCPKPQSSCPAPVLQKPAPIESSCCAMPTVRTCGVPVQTGCCPVDPKDVSKAQKEALHAQHEAAEACQKQQKAIAKAQHELDEKYAKEQRRIDKANAHLNHEVSEFQEANAKYESFFGGPAEATAEVTPQPQPEQRAEVQPILPVAPEPTPQITQPQQPEEIAAIIETTPTLAPPPTPEPTTPTRLPRTAGEMTLIGLIGMVSLTGGYLTRFLRR
jgi:hypothetical protein